MDDRPSAATPKAGLKSMATPAKASPGEWRGSRSTHPPRNTHLRGTRLPRGKRGRHRTPTPGHRTARITRRTRPDPARAGSRNLALTPPVGADAIQGGAGWTTTDGAY